MNSFRKVLDNVFVVGVIAFMLMGSAIVLIQAYCIVVADGALSKSIMKTLGKPTFIIASITGLIGFVQGYLKGWTTKD